LAWLELATEISTIYIQTPKVVVLIIVVVIVVIVVVVVVLEAIPTSRCLSVLNRASLEFVACEQEGRFSS